MKRSPGYPLLGAVIGGAIGGLIGLAFLKISLWFILVGVVVGVPIGVRGGLMNTEAGDAMDSGGIGCLMTLAEIWFTSGCIGCCTMVVAVLSGILVGVLFLVR